MKKLKPLPRPKDKVIHCPGCDLCDDNADTGHRWIERLTANGWTVVYDSVDGPRVPIDHLPRPLRDSIRQAEAMASDG